MTSIPYIKFYPSDWRGGVTLLSDFQEMLYFKICLHNWDSGEGLHIDLLPRLFRDPCKGIAPALRALVDAGKIIEKDGLLLNVRAVEIHGEAQQRRADAIKAAGKRWEYKRKLNNTPAMPQQGKGTCQPEPEPEPKEDPPKRAPPKSPKTKRGTHLPDDWQPNDEERNYAKDLGNSDRQLTDLIEGFSNYYANGEGRKKTFLDWRRTWQGWCRRDIDFHKDPRKRGGRTEADDRTAILAGLAGELEGERGVAGGGDGGILGATH